MISRDTIEIAAEFTNTQDMTRGEIAQYIVDNKPIQSLTAQQANTDIYQWGVYEYVGEQTMGKWLRWGHSLTRLLSKKELLEAAGLICKRQAGRESSHVTTAPIACLPRANKINGGFSI